MPIVCLAVIGQLNNPLFIKSFPAVDAERELKLHFIVHCALDAVEEKVLLKRGPVDSYLGLLYPTEEFRVYGYLSNTNIKFICITDDASIKDEGIHRVLRALHALHVDAVCNPFFSQLAQSPSFGAQIDQLVA